MQRRGWLLGALAGLSLSACGFRLRSWELGSAFDGVVLENPGRHAIGEPLRRAITQTSVPLMSGADARAEALAPARLLVLRVLEAGEDLRTASVGGNARTAEYELTARVRFDVTDGSGAALAAPRWAQARRVYLLDRGNLVGSNEEQALLRREMHTDLVQQVMRVLNAVSRQPPSPQTAAG